MRLARLKLPNDSVGVGIVGDEVVQLLDLPPGVTLMSIINALDPMQFANCLISRNQPKIPIASAQLLAPIDQQEVWAAGVTYLRSQIARMEESESGASHYDKVYTAPRPEIFFKATPNRVSGPGEPLRVRADSRWSVPEPELALVISSKGKLVGFTVGNDMSARDIEGENPLYLPQAKVYNQCCGLGPCILIPESPINREATQVKLTIERAGKVAFQGDTHLGMMKRTFQELVDWLVRENDLINGAFLLTGTGVVPPDNFTLQEGDQVAIEITGIGVLRNPIVQRKN